MSAHPLVGPSVEGAGAAFLIEIDGTAAEGTGDPGISDRFFLTRTRVFENLAEQLAAEGITHIDGAIVGDATYFSGPDLGPEWDPRDLNERFAAPASALSFNENIVTLRITPAARLGGVPTIETIPPGFPLEMNNTAETVAGRPRPRLWLDRPTPTSLIRVDGEITQGGPAIWRRLTVPDPALFAARALREVLESRGFTVGDGSRAVHRADRSRITGREAWAPRLIGDAEPRILARHSSPEMIEYLNVVNHDSHNLFAETIFKTMGKVVMGQGSFEGGARAVRAFTAGEVGLGRSRHRRGGRFGALGQQPGDGRRIGRGPAVRSRDASLGCVRFHASRSAPFAAPDVPDPGGPKSPGQDGDD